MNAMSQKIEVEGMKYHNETRIALLEKSIEHIEDSLREIKHDFKVVREEIREVNEDVRSSFITTQKLLTDIDHRLEQRLNNFNSQLWTNFYWILGILFSLSGIMGGMMAKGFKWF